MMILRALCCYIDYIVALFRIYKYRQTIPKRVKVLRKKQRIKIVFVLSDLSLWKTKGLYVEMLKHPRFLPVLALTPMMADSATESMRKYNRLKQYLDNDGYEYIELTKDSFEALDTDIIIYQQPYDVFLGPDFSFRKIMHRALIIHISYGIHNLSASRKHVYPVDQPLQRYAWQIYMENKDTLVVSKYTLLRGKNMVVTGVPIQDQLIASLGMPNTSWKSLPTGRKRIIWAPHHTLPIEGAYNFINLSTFLDVYDIMLELADKYKDEVQFAFKPHPFLKKKLYYLWGAEKTEAYYAQWSARENTQIVEGEYQNLFSNSDALIHDCNSFQIEYSFTCKPCMFLIHPQNVEHQLDELNQFGKRAFELHDFGISRLDIESFILRVVSGQDSRIQKRIDFFENYLLPPYGKTASQNIMNAILGEVEYSE